MCVCVYIHMQHTISMHINQHICIAYIERATEGFSQVGLKLFAGMRQVRTRSTSRAKAYQTPHTVCAFHVTAELCKIGVMEPNGKLLYYRV